MFLVNVWFNSELVASVSEAFKSRDDARLFAQGYDTPEYSDAVAVIFDGAGNVVPR